MSLPLTFNPAFAGAQQVWMSAVGGAGSSGWQQRGNWTVTAPVQSVQAVSVAPGSGSGSSQTSSFQFSDSSGGTDLQNVWMWLAPNGTSVANICMAYYNRAGNSINLLNDAGTAWTTMTVGTAGTLQNSQCSLNVGTTAATASGNTLIVSLPL